MTADALDLLALRAQLPPGAAVARRVRRLTEMRTTPRRSALLARELLKTIRLELAEDLFLPLRCQRLEGDNDHVRTARRARAPKVGREAGPAGRAREAAKTDASPDTVELMAAGAVILSATGRETVEDGLEWIAAGYPLDQSVDEHTLLEALCDVDAPQSAYLETALRRVARQVSASSLDSAAVLFDPELITAPEAFRRALDLVAAKCQDKTLSSITADAVVAAQRKVPETMETLCAVAGLSYSELATRVSELPNDPRGRWSPQQVSAAFKALDDVVNDRVTGGLAGAVPVRAYEALTCSPPGWAAVEGFRANGVPYEVLLGQRSAGGSWLAHRNRTSNRIGRVLVDNVCEALKSRGVPYMRSSAVGGDVAPGELSRRTGCDKQVGLVALDLNEEPAFAIVVSTARDSGTASKNANRLARMTRPSGLPVAVLVAGPGWASRNETAALAQSFGGKLYSDTSIDALADAVASVAKHE